MIDPVLSLAISMHSNKGVYALLLGSGVSRSSGIPTGWEITQDLIQRIAHLEGQPCEPDPDNWFRQKFGIEPRYSEVLDQIAKSSAERGQVLRSFFEPTKDERAEGIKQPTQAHRAIADLVAKGYVRIIITTNFDRLLEQALAEAGIQPVVISTPDSAQGALPLAHSRCSIIKINGDYLDTRLKNTSNELTRYEPSMEQLLDRVFDEYGLIVSGWSAEWDTALRTCIERCSSRRFTTYWAHRGKIGERAASLISLRNASAISTADADSFFKDLDEKIAALESFSVTDPLSAKVAVARLKKYLSDEQNRINLHDLFAAETERVRQANADGRFSVSAPFGSITGQVILTRLQHYENELRVLSPLSICGAYWSTPQQYSPMLQSFKRFTDQYGPEAGDTLLLCLRRYPSLVLMYGVGMGALANSNYRFLKAFLYQFIRTNKNQVEQPLAAIVHHQKVLRPDAQKLLPGRDREHTPLSNHLFQTLREPLREYLPDDNVYDATFDWLEYLLCLVHCDVSNTRQALAERKTSDQNFTLWAPVGRFGWKNSEGSILQATGLRDNGELPDIVAAVLQAGFFESGAQLKSDKYFDIKHAFDRHVALLRGEWSLYS